MLSASQGSSYGLAVSECLTELTHHDMFRHAFRPASAAVANPNKKMRDEWRKEAQARSAPCLASFAIQSAASFTEVNSICRR